MELTQQVQDIPADKLSLLVERLKRKQAGAGGTPELVGVPRSGPLPLSFSQQRLWFLGQLDPGSSSYNLPGALRLQGRLHREALAAAVAELVRRHETLRTRIVDHGGEPRQEIDPVEPGRPWPLPWIDLAALPSAVRDCELQVQAKREGRRPFDLAHGPLLRLLLFKLGADDQAMVYNLHHIISDGWSAIVLTRELATLYEAYRQGRPSPLSALRIQYADFAVWQRAHLEGVLAGQLAWWRERLAGCRGLELPADRPRPAVQRFRGRSRGFELDPAFTLGLRELARRSGATLFMALLAVWKTFLLRSTEEADVVVGTPIANRNRPEVEGLIGFFSNTLVLRTDLAGEPSGREVLARVQEVTLGAFEHESLPFELLVEQLGSERDLSRNPLFQLMCVMQNQPQSRFPAGDLVLTPLALGRETAKFDLTIVWQEVQGRIEGGLEYDTDLFDDCTVRRFLRHFERLGRALVAEPEAPVSALPLLDEGERHQLLGEWSGTNLPAGAEDEAFLHERFFAQARRTPEATALVVGERRWRYGELAARVLAGAAELRRLGVGPEVRVGVAGERTAGMVVALLSVLAAGGAYVPLDPAYPEARREAMRADSGAALLLAGDSLAALEALADRAVSWSAGIRTWGTPDNLAYLIYTSGSTGTPKGVAIAHRNAVALLDWAAATFSPAELSGVLAATSIGFDLAVFEIFVPLATGGAVILAESVLALPELAAAAEITLVNTVPSAMAALVRAGAVPRSVRTVNLAGEPLTGRLARKVLAAGPKRLLNLYGPSEDTTYSTLCEFASVTSEPASGRPIAGGRAYVADRALQPLGLGMVGELCLGGAGVARGYLGRPDLTAERFVPDPWSDLAGGRLYRTGDLVRYRQAGDLDFLGRLDHQVKIRGFRIELGEIEASLLRMPGVREAAVLVREGAGAEAGEPGDRRLVAYWAGGRAETPDEPALATALASELPAHMVPAGFVRLAALPRSPNGKVDRPALAALAADASSRTGSGGAVFVSPEGEHEELLAKIWEAVLGIEKVGAEDNFFRLGGHSLLATQVVSRSRDAFGVELPLRALFETPTVAALAARISRLRQSGNGIALPPLAAGPRPERLPLSYAQERLWFLDRFEPATSTYNLAAALRLAGRIDIASLESSFSELVRRQESLRTCFPERGGEPEQVVLAAPPVALPVIDLTALGPLAQGEARRTAEACAFRPFDLARGPLFRPLLLRLGAERAAIVVAMHHIVSDGWSMDLLVGELAALYAAACAGRPSPLPPLPLQYADYALWQRRWLAASTATAASPGSRPGGLSDYARRLADIPPELELPTDRPRPAVRTTAGATVAAVLRAELTADLQRFARAQGATLFMVLLAGFEALLARYSGQDLLAVGTPIAGRNHLEIEDLVGFFVNTLVLRADTAGEPSGGELLARVREETLLAYEQQDLPFERLLEELAPERSLSRTPLFQAVFVLQNSPLSRGRQPIFPGLSLAPFPLRGKTAKFDLTLGVAEHGECLDLSLEFSTDLFDRATPLRFLDHYERLLGGLAAASAGSGDPVAGLPLLSPSESHQLLVEGGAPLRPARPETCLHELLARQVTRAPEAVAVVSRDACLSYGELDRRARRMARRLRSLGVGVGSLVGLAVERGLSLVESVLGIFQAGGAYVPFEPTLPAERLVLLARKTRLRWAIAGPGPAERLAEGGVQVLAPEELLARAPGAVEPAASSPPLFSGLPEAPAYVIHTSGSTGEPKGVVVSHANVARLFAVTEDRFGFTAGDVWSLFHSYAFDFSVWEIFGALLYGGRLVVVPQEMNRSPRAFRALLAAERVTVLSQVPSAFAQLAAADAADAANAIGSDLALSWVIFGGEALNPQSLRAWWERHGGERPALVNMYGITETTVHVTFRRLGREDVFGTPASVLGVPLADLGGYVLDRRGRPVPLGVAGELSVGGAGLAAGYAGHPELTASRFVPNPFPYASPGGRLYRSGDLVRRRASGELEYLGRIDRQVKVRGFRIELGEIEAALARHRAVGAVAVVVREDGGAGDAGEDRRLVAYVVPAPETALPTVEEMRRHLAASLPEYMVPAAFVPLAALPLTGNGKLDRAALPPPGGGRPDLGERYVAPRTPEEAALAAVWSRVLNVDRVGVHDNFFALGGDSILSLRVVAQAAQEGLTFTLPDLFRSQTVAALAASLESTPPPEPTVARPPAAAFSLVRESDRPRLPEDLEDAYPLAFLQAGMLYYMMLTPDEPAYRNVDSWHLRGTFAEEPFRAAVARTVARHPALRTAFDLTRYSEPLQLVYRTAELEVEVEDLRHLGAAEQEAEVDAFLARERRRPFPLDRAPQLSFHIFRRGETSFQFTVTENHAIFDGWSLHATLTEIFDLYFALLRGEAREAAPPPRLTYRDFVIAEREAAASPEAAAYWAGVLDRSPATELAAWPTPESAAGEGGARMRHLARSVPPAVFHGLKALAREAEAPWKSVLLAAHLHVLGRACGQSEVVTGLVGSGRSEGPGGDDVRGLFLNTLPLRCRLAAGSFVDLVRRVFAAEQALLPFRRYPFAVLQREHGRRPLYEVAFNYIHFHVARDLMRMGELEVLSFKRGPGTNFKLAAHFMQDLEGRSAVYELEYDRRQLPDTQVLALAGLYERTLAAMAADPAAPWQELSVLSPAETQQAIHEWNDTRASGDEGEAGAGGFVARFARQVARRPEAVAVAGPGGPLSYRDLDTAAARLAGRLRAAGVGPEVAVGLLVPRRASLVVAMVAVLRSGGCYVPLDAAYPAERLSFMLEDSKAAVLLLDEDRPDLAVPGSCRVLRLGADEALAEGGEESDGYLPESLAYQIYTSGSTGRPKAVGITHRNLASLIAWAHAAFRPEELAGVVAGTSICFDLSVFEILVPLALGGRVIVAENALAVPQLAERDEVTLINTVPSAMAELVRRVAELPSLRTVALAGEALRQGLVERLHGAGVGRVLNLYGPSEDTTYSTCGPQPSGFASTPPIGRPLSGKRLYVLDTLTRQPVPRWVAGEIHLGGEGVARGYLGRPDLTAERFVPDPFGRWGERLYRTGDLGRFRLDGEVEFLGRIDQQVKLRGFRIELGEIEAALAACPGVRDGAVALAEEPGGERHRLVAYVVAQAGSAVTATTLRDELRRRLPEYMLPGDFVLLAELPRTATGKLDRRALSGSGGASLASSAVPYSPPRNPTEERLSAIWRELLGREQAGIHDSFFDLGGHSLLLLELQRQIHRHFDREISMVELFRTPTIAGLARGLSEGRQAPTAAREGDERAQARLAARRRPARSAGPSSGNREGRG